MKKIYISGSIAGLNYQTALNNFLECEKFLREQGKFEPINPAKYIFEKYDHSAMEWVDLMRLVIKKMLDKNCSTICLLASWKKSKGASTEAILAFSLGYEIYRFFHHCGKGRMERII